MSGIHAIDKKNGIAISYYGLFADNQLLKKSYDKEELNRLKAYFLRTKKFNNKKLSVSEAI